MKQLKLLNVGFGNIIPSHEVIAIVSPDSSPIKRLVQKAKEEKNKNDKALTDYTNGRKARAVIITDTSKVFLSSLQPETIVNRVSASKVDLAEDLMEDEDRKSGK